MRGVLTSLLCNWNGQIFHNHRGDLEKSIRYLVGISRSNFLRNNLEAFAKKGIPDSEGNITQQVAYLVELDEGDADPKMIEGTKFEYLVGNKNPDGSFLIFGYIWFASLADAKSYVSEKHSMNILPGW